MDIILLKTSRSRLVLLISILFLFNPNFSFSQHFAPGLLLHEKSNNIQSENNINSLPFFGKNLKKNGHSSPLPFGIASSVFMYEQEFISKDLKITASLVNGQELSAFGDSVKQNTTASEIKAYIKPNVWILPFLNIHGIFGYTSGKIKPNLFVNGIIIEDLPGIGDYKIDTTFILDDIITYVGSTFGFGSSLSLGYKDFFLLLDYQYTITHPSDLDGKLDNHYLSTKLGYIFKPKNNNLYIVFWAGAMYINNNQSFTGELTVKEIAPELVPIFGESAFYTGTIEAKSNLNALMGASITVDKHHNIFSEFGFINRKQISIGYNFMF